MSMIISHKINLRVGLNLLKSPWFNAGMATAKI